MKLIIRPPLTLFFALCLCAACQPVASPPTPTATLQPEPSVTPVPSPSPSPLPTDTPQPTRPPLDYKVIYQDGAFAIREAFLGVGTIWHWDDFPMPERAADKVPSLGLGQNMTCDESSNALLPCSQTVEIPLAGGGSDTYILRLKDPMGGNGLLMKNGRIIWTGFTNGAGANVIIASKQIGSEIVFEYSKSNYGSGDGPFWVTDSILLTRGKSVVLFSDAFAPNVIRDQLIYFKAKGKQKTLVFGGKEVGDIYDEIFNLRCCWHGPPLQITDDGNTIDFFAQKSDGWYHVQAGYLSGTP